MDLDVIIYKLSVILFPVMLGIILHEVAHAYAADYCGDSTAKMLGRLTINPVPHIDPMGTLFLVLTAISGSFIFGWAKPVPTNPRNFTRVKSLKAGMMYVALAGPLTNFILAVVFTFLLKFYLLFASPEFMLSSTGTFLREMFFAGITINLVLGIVNLIPIPPLDGSHILANFLPYPLDSQYMSLGRYGMVILLLLIMLNVIGYIVRFFLGLIQPIIVNFLM